MEDARLRSIDRGYHSTAVLMPDATVLSAGSGEFFDDSKKPNNPIDSHRQARSSIRPICLGAPARKSSTAPRKSITVVNFLFAF
jgi:galactose oxidase